MLQTIDVLLGFALVMLILSAIVTMLVQWMATTLSNLKGRVLKEGVAHLLRLLDKGGLTNQETQDIADHILRDTLVGKKKLFFGGVDLASAIHREELVKLILDFAANADLAHADKLAKDQNDRTIEGEARLRARLLNSLKNNEIEAPGEILKAVRGTMLALERTRPDLANDVRQSLALATHASSEFLAKTNAWFDQTIDRTTETFTRKIRVWTVIVATLVALFFQADTFQLLHRLSTDKQATATLVNLAVTQPERFATLANQPSVMPNPAPTSALTPATTHLSTSTSTFTSDAGTALENIKNNPELKQLVDTNLIAWPSDFDEWWHRAGGTRVKVSPDKFDWTLYGLLTHLFGVLLTAGLLTLGAPVWYEILKDLIQLRSVSARKDDEQRSIRQTSQEGGTRAPPSPIAMPGATSSAGRGGDKGDMPPVTPKLPPPPR